MQKSNKTIIVMPVEIKGMHTFLWGLILLFLGLAVGLGAYYSHIGWFRYVAFSLLVGGIITLFFSMKQDLEQQSKSSFFSFVLMVLLLVLYVSLRTALPRFDFSVGDASDYYMAGVCSVTYSQDIGFFLPLTASVSALGYTVFGIAYTPAINVLLYASSIPLSYFLFRRLVLSGFVAYLMTLFLILTPLSIWFSKTSFSEPIWQLMLLSFSFIALHISDKERPDFRAMFALFLLLGLIPFLRGEAALLYGLVMFVGLYHMWKFKNTLSSLFIVSSLSTLIVGIYLALGIRAHYLLGWQFSRVIPDITESQLMNILYIAFVIAVVLVMVLGKVKQGFSRIKLPFIFTVLAVLFKVVIAYIYAIKKEGSFQDFFFMNEYGFMLGNFGFPLSLFIIWGLFILHYKAIKGDRLALILVIMYTIFYIPFVMQTLTFQDPHELFLYWNRYYFAILMVIHVFALGLTVQFLHVKLQKVLGSKYSILASIIVLLGLSLFSMNTKVQAITIDEAYLENSYKIFPWLVERVGDKPISVVYDTSVEYRRHNGRYDLKVFVSRMFTVLKINAKSYQKATIETLNADFVFDPKIEKSKYVLCLSSQQSHLDNEHLSLIDTLILPISWREHYQAHPKDKKNVEGKIEDSIKNEVQLHVMLYKIK